MKKVKITDAVNINNPLREHRAILNAGGVLSQVALELLELKSRAQTDCNLAVNTGVYQCNNDVLNAPRTGQGAASGGVLVTFKGHDRRLAQIFAITGIGNHELYFRTRSYQTEATFSAWIKLG